MEVVGRVKQVARQLGERAGYEVRRAGVPVEPGAPEMSDVEARYRADAAVIVERHGTQTAADVAALRRKYEVPLFGEVRVWDLVERLAMCIDPTDTRLFSSSQQVHVLQMIEAMEDDGVLDDDMLLTALVHDLGKVLLLTDEDPANVVCMNSLVADAEPGAGLANCTFQWNHDEFGWSRLVDHVPEHIAWMTRFHSMDPTLHRHLMDEQDLVWADRYLTVLFHYDHEFKSPYRRPRTRIADYRDVIEDAFPKPIRF